MTILVTGSAGHLGEAIVRTLRGRGSPARGIDLKPSPFTDAVGSIVDPAFVREQMNGVTAVIHTATLHKPHVATHSKQDFVDTNVSGTLNLLEAAVAAGVKSFVFTSTTSAFGSQLRPEAGQAAVWVTEELPSVPKNIYGTTKLMAENLCELFFRERALPVVTLRTSRFFPEDDDDPAMRSAYALENAQANELLYRRLDIADAVSAHLLAVERAPGIGFARYIVSATSPFEQRHLGSLARDAAAVVRELYPECSQLYAARGWRLLPAIDRVYVNERARRELGWRPEFDFAHVLRGLRDGRDVRSTLAREVGSKGYHDTLFDDGPYPVAS
ncbi:MULTISPECIES: NAD-dependent epimerase/dehydratase family protein [Bradyrhizobium]|uniref:NAD-dependent epimerase/dehydratase family protein n=1 Tax=Bradyrhizobium TaxID=374 RepID=UPI00155E82B9|nr:MULTISPECIES: NAD(P)-dependent oxidoreductase [Bradyrhizobium]MDD1521792.1 NAD-dependent epimerase [Bradyrhizobium sp. WBAH30]MDD1544638.1 NAD-dependent epimerase [Bradyrhizobium sp. WBAH41]MDD1559401.1 NAD-dependent epimerase [Bradyrhizobium sp. WBAH23]MDD1566916.1 NAD-dependent epimerase [Bradyrhizobium sp. WBAH33]MDD1592934.1 NAD-dependent epimerase [Bradyrhizobium sp. WBAH42]